MAVDINTYRTRIGAFNAARATPSSSKCKSFYPVHCAIIAIYLWSLFIKENPGLYKNTMGCSTKSSIVTPYPSRIGKIPCLVVSLINLLGILLLCGDIESNPGPQNQINRISVHDNMSIYYLNAQSIKATSKSKAKLIEFKNLTYTLKPDLFGVSETWLIKQAASSSVISADYYQLYRKDRVDQIGGGVALLVKNDIWSKEREDLYSPIPTCNEMIAVEIRPNPRRKILALSCYRSQAHKSSDFLPNFDFVLDKGIKAGFKDIIVLGDFNYHDIKWGISKYNELPKECKDFLDILNKYNLKQLNTHPSTKDGNTLDLIIHNLPETASEVTLNRMIYTSDHYLIDTTLPIEKSIPQEIPRSVYNFKRGDMEGLKESIQTSNLIHGDPTNIDTMWKGFKSSLMTLVNHYIPKVNIKNKSAPPWIDAEVIETSRLKEKAYKKAKQNKTEYRWKKYTDLRNSIKNLVSAKYKAYLENLTNNIGQNPKRFWNFFKGMYDQKGKIPDLIHNGKELSNPIDKANAFNETFQKVFTTSNIPYPPTAHPKPIPGLSDITITKEEVNTLLSELNPDKALGPDKIPTQVLKECSQELKGNITDLYNESLTSGKVPTEWKTANVAPIYKKGKNTDPSNYRPISLLPIISKVLERCIYNKIIDHIRPRLSNFQHGFLKGRSTTGQMLTVISNITKILDNNLATDVIYLDLSKAFDTVPHKALIHKLQQIGVGGNLLKWFSDYLKDRYQRVTINGATSNWLKVTSGVPQGSILGPLLFLIYINDLPDTLSPNTKCAIFADDTKLYREITGINDANELQQDLTKVANWGESWGLKFNIAKCKALKISRAAPVPNIESQYHMNNVAVENTDSMVDLGVTVVSNLKWNNHISAVIKKANSTLWMCIRNMGFNSPFKAKRTIYMALIRSKIEFNSVIWSPHNKDDLTKLEGVQRRSTNFMTKNPRRPSPHHINYTERLKQCNLLPLSYRREVLDIIFFLKSYHGRTGYDVNQYLEFSVARGGRQTRQNTLGCHLKTKNLNVNSLYNAQFYPARVCRIWNSLPIELKETLKPLCESLVIKQFINPYYYKLRDNYYDPDNTCTWINFCRCPRCRH